jgi:serine/threonine protein phosphatase 1
MRTWVIPDVHGCLRTLRALVEDLIVLRDGDELIFLGDLIDRGPDSRGVMDYIMELQQTGTPVTVLKGNHEDYLVRVFHDEQNRKGVLKLMGWRSPAFREWMKFGGDTTLAGFGAEGAAGIPAKYIEWIESMPYYVEYRDFLIVHAGFNFREEDIFSDTYAMMWIRDYQIDAEKLGNRRIIHGHVPVTLDFIHQSVTSSAFRFIDLDNGVYMNNKPGFGNLLALELNKMELLIQPNLDF